MSSPNETDPQLARILVVDDDPDVVDYMTSVLEDHGYQVDSARNAAEALSKLEESRPSTVILDVLLPGRSGLDLLVTLRRDPRWWDIPLVVITGSDQFLEDDCESYLSSFEGVRGPDGVLGKPVDRHALLSILRVLVMLGDFARSPKKGVASAPTKGSRYTYRPGRRGSDLSAQGRLPGLPDLTERLSGQEETKDSPTPDAGVPMLKTVEQVMVPMRYYPHAPSSLSVADALLLMKLPRWVEKRPGSYRAVPHDLLVFSDDLEFMGIVRRRAILRALQPEFLFPRKVKYRERSFNVKPDADILALSGDEELSEEKIIESMRRRANKRIEEIMIPLERAINHDDDLTQAINQIVESRTGCLPVIKDGNVVGMIRSEDVLREVESLLGIHFP
ncbi:MAG: response regulator [Planctomycetota bacterium]|jgi:CheY-like chemotaxis protein